MGSICIGVAVRSSRPLGAILQAGLGVRALEQFEQAVGAVLLPVQEVLAAGMVGLIDHDQLPGLGLDQLLLPLPPLRQVAGRQEHRVGVPRVRPGGHLQSPCRTRRRMLLPS